MKTCPNCAGDGLVGQGEQPWLRQGHIVKCAQCSGTGKVSDGTEPEVAPEPAPEVAPGVIVGALDTQNTCPGWDCVRGTPRIVTLLNPLGKLEGVV